VRFDIEAYVKDNLDNVRTTTTGELTAECPWCNRHGGFYVNPKEGHYVCFKCEERGRYLIGLVAKVEQVTHAQARTYIVRNSVEFRRQGTTQSLLEKIQDLRPDQNRIETEQSIDVGLPDEFIPVYDDKNKRWKYPSYLKSRKVSRQTSKDWGLGYCIKGRYASRVIIPVECPRGQSFIARDITGNAGQKILNPPGADHNQLLIGWKHVPSAMDMALVEGPFDAIKMHQHGIPAMAVGGKVLHSAQLAQLFTRPADSAIVIMLDPEENLAPYDMAAQLMCRCENVLIGRLPLGVDPGASTPEQAHETYNAAVPFRGNRAGRLDALLSASRSRVFGMYAGSAKKINTSSKRRKKTKKS